MKNGIAMQIKRLKELIFFKWLEQCLTHGKQIQKMIIIILEIENGRKGIIKEIIQEKFSEMKDMSVNIKQTTREPHTMNEAHTIVKFPNSWNKEKKLPEEKQRFCTKDQEAKCHWT